MEQVTLPATAAKLAGAKSAPTGAAGRLQVNPGPWWAGALRVLGPALATAGLLWLCFFPMAWGWLAWVALVPLLALVRSRARAWAVYFSATLGGLAFYLTVLRWMPVADDRMYATWGALSTYCALYLPVTLLLVRWLERRSTLPLVLTLPVVWTSLEYLRSFLLTGFAWYFLGHTQHRFLPVIQVCDLGGVYMVSFLVAAVNAWAFEMLYSQGWFRELLGQRDPAPCRDPFAWRAWRRLALQGGCVAALVAAALGYGQYRLQEDSMSPGPRVALLQGNLDQRLRNDTYKDRSFGPVLRHYNALNSLAVTGYQPDLVVWPETSCPKDWLATASSVPIEQIPRDWADFQILTQDDFHRGVASQKTNMLFGLTTEVLVDPTRRPMRYNSALMFHYYADRGARTGERYDKIHRVPFGEYVPLRDWLPFMDAFAPYDYDYSITAGDKLTRFDLGRYAFGVLICYEDTDPFLARQYGASHRDGRAVDFLINISNDGWFDGSSEHEEHLALCRFRAIEARRSVARSVNMGISAVIDSNGRVLKPRDKHKVNTVTNEVIGEWAVMEEPGHVTELPVEEWSAKKKVAGVLVAHIPIDHRTSLYSLWGDWLPIGGWSLLGLVFAWPAGSRLVRGRPAPTPTPKLQETRIKR